MTNNPTILPERLAELTNGGMLAKGGHGSFHSGACAMEWVSYLAGEGFTDDPECASPVLRTFTIGLNDQWDSEQRQKLAPFLPRMVGTAGDGKDEVRSYMALDWLVRTFTPAWLDLAGLTEEARSLRDLRRIVDLAAAEVAGPVVRTAQTFVPLVVIDRAAVDWRGLQAQMSVLVVGAEPMKRAGDILAVVRRELGIEAP